MFHITHNFSTHALALRFLHVLIFLCSSLFQIKLIVKWELVDDQDKMLFCWKIPVEITS